METIQKNKLNNSNTNKKIYDKNDCQKILQNVENIKITHY